MSTPITAPRLETAIDVTGSVTTTTVTYTVQNADRMSIQTNATDTTPGDPVAFVAADVDPSDTASGTITITDYTLATGAVVTVAGTALTEGVDWTAETSNAVTADNLASAIDGLASVVAPNPAAAIITVSAATAGTVGNSIATVLTSGAGVTVQQATLAGGTDVSTITVTAHGLVTGLAVALTGTNLPTGLSATDYWIIAVDVDTIRLASSYANAVAGTFVTISAAGTTADAELTPAALGSSTVTVKGSLDGVTYFAYATPKTITITTSGSQFLDCGQLTVPYVQIQWVAPVEGSLTLEVLAWFQNTQVKNNS